MGVPSAQPAPPMRFHLAPIAALALASCRPDPLPPPSAFVADTLDAAGPGAYPCEPARDAAGEPRPNASGYRFAFPAAWAGRVVPYNVPPAFPEATSAVKWRFVPADSVGARHALLTLMTFAPDDWARVRAPGAATVVARDASSVVVAAWPEANPYAGTPDADAFARLTLPADSVRARVSLR